MANANCIGVVLAGGTGRRMGGAKATAVLAKRPLIAYPVSVLQNVLGRVAVVAKPAVVLPVLPGVERWDDDEPRQHPLVGLVTALRRADGADIVAVAVDCPLVTSALVERLARADLGDASAVIADAGDGRMPLVGRFTPAALDALSGADPDGRVHDALLGLHPRRIAVEDPRELLNVNTPEDLARAEAILAPVAPAGLPPV